MNAKTLNGSVHLVNTFVAILSECENVIKHAEEIAPDGEKEYFAVCAREVGSVVSKAELMTEEFKRLAERCMQ